MYPYVEDLNPTILESDLFGNRIITDVISKDQVILSRVYPNPTGILIKRGNVDTNDTGEMPCEDEDKRSR